MFRFTIRDVLWLMVVVGLGVGWWVDRSSLSERLDHDEKIIGGLKLLDKLNPSWQEELAGYIETLAKKNSAAPSTDNRP